MGFWEKVGAGLVLAGYVGFKYLTRVEVDGVNLESASTNELHQLAAKSSRDQEKINQIIDEARRRDLADYQQNSDYYHRNRLPRNMLETAIKLTIQIARNPNSVDAKTRQAFNEMMGR